MEYILGAPAQHSPQWNDNWSDIVEETNKAVSLECGGFEIIWEWSLSNTGGFEPIPNSTNVFHIDQANRQITKVQSTEDLQ